MGSSTDGGLNLIFDADDTLWDSNIHFLEAERAFICAVGALGIDADGPQIKASLRRSELEIIKSHGYGRVPYVAALHRTPRSLRRRTGPRNCAPRSRASAIIW
jgi:hypothetical protein